MPDTVIKERATSGSAFPRLLISLVLIVGILYVAKAFIVPLALAVLLTFVLVPIVARLQYLGLSRVPAVVLTVVSALALLGAVTWGVGLQVNLLAQQLPAHKEKIQKKIADLRGSGEGAFGTLFEMIREIGEEPGKNEAAKLDAGAQNKQVIVARASEPSGFERLFYTIVPVLEPLATSGLILILVVFMLSSREDLRNRFIGILGHGRLTGTTRVIVDTAQRLSQFLLTQLLVNVGFGAVFGVGLILIGVPYAFLWGFLTSVLRFIPYIGTWISVTFPLTLSFALSPDWAQPITVFVFFASMDLIVANVIEPLLIGHSTGVTPIALLVAAAFWTWVWGTIGLVLSTPLTVCLVVLGQHIPRFRFFALLLGNQAPLKAHVSYYQRLLAKDVKEAKQIALAYAGERGTENVFDDVLLPALYLAQLDRKQEGLNPEDEEFIFEATKEILAGLESELAPVPADGLPGPQVNQAVPAPILILGCPARQKAEELSLHMLGLLMKPDGFHVEVLSTRTLPKEVEARIEEEKPALVFIAVLPTGGLVQVRYLCKRLRKRFTDVPLVVGYWGVHRSFDRLLVRLRAAGASYVATSLLQSRSQIRALTNPGAAQAPLPPVATVGVS